MKMSLLRGSMVRRWPTRLVLPLSLSLAGVLAPAHGQSSEELPPVILTQAVGVSFQKNPATTSGGTLSLGTNAGSAAAVTAGLSSGGTLSLGGGVVNTGYPTGVSALTVSSGTLQFGPDYAGTVNFSLGTLSRGTLQVSNSQRITDYTGTVIFNEAILVGESFTGGVIPRTISPTSLIRPSGSLLDLAHLYNVQPTETTGGLVKTGTGTLELAGATTIERPTIYPLDPSVAPTGLLTGGVIRLFDPASGLISGGTLSLVGGTTRPLVTLGGTLSPGFTGTSILSGARLDLATGTTIVPTTGSILTVNGAGTQTLSGSNTMTINANTFTGSPLSVTSGTLIVRTAPISGIALNGSTLVSDGPAFSLIDPVPEPGSAALLLSGALGLAARRRRRR